MKFKFPIALLLLLASLVIFDAFQQKYYMEAFQLSSEQISIYTLIQTHWIRWTLWTIATIPLAWFTWKRLKKSPNHIETKPLFQLIIGSGLSVIFALTLLSFQSIYIRSEELSFVNFSETYLFFTFQKGLLFLIANGLLILMIHRKIRSQSLSDQLMEIHSLKRNEEQLTAALRVSSSQLPPQFEIKIGNKIKTISTDQIIWIQANDYCVKIHTKEDQSFTIRKSLKSLEKELAAFRFVRIHRGALLNLNYLDLIDTESSTVRLSNSDEIAASKTGLRSLRKQVAI